MLLLNPVKRGFQWEGKVSGFLEDGKELAQASDGRAFSTGDFRAGYYRDQDFYDGF